MSTIETLESYLEQALRLGYEIRYEWFGGTGGGICQLGNRKCLFLDLALGPIDHLVTVTQLLRDEGVDPMSKRIDSKAA